jgi:hypothetical protein
MDLTNQVHIEFSNRDCEIEWLSEESEHKWNFNAETWFSNEKGEYISPKSGKDIVDHIFCFEPDARKKNFNLMLHKLVPGCYHKVVPDDKPIYVLYYDYQ